MRNFHLISSGAQVAPLLLALKQQDLAGTASLWNQNRLRQDYEGSPHKAVDDIWLRFQEIGASPQSVVDEHECIPYRAWFELPHVRGLVRDLMQVTEAVRVGRVIISRLPPGKKIDPHADIGSVAEYYSRYQFVLQSEPGCSFHIEDEEVQMSAGQVWWINNRLVHAVVNNSTSDRIGMIVDLRSDLT